MTLIQEWVKKIYKGWGTPTPVSDYFPTMTANTQDWFTASSSATLGNAPAYYAFETAHDFHSSSIWNLNWAWSEIVLPSPFAVNEITACSRAYDNYNPQLPAQFVLEGTNDGDYYVTLLTVSAPFSAANQEKTWSVSNTTPYNRYRLRLQAWSSWYVAIRNWNIDWVVDLTKTVKKVFKGTTQIRPTPGITPDEDWQFPASDLSGWVYPWWTLKSGIFGQWSLGSDWTTAGRGSAACVMYRSISWNFKLQHRCWYFNAEWWWTHSCWVTTNTIWNGQVRPWMMGTRFQYWSTISGSYNEWSGIFIDSSKLVTTSQLTSGTKYIDEIVYENGVYTVSLYEDVNWEPGILLYTQSAASSDAPEVVWVYHEVGTGTATQTNWVKVRYL